MAATQDQINNRDTTVRSRELGKALGDVMVAADYNGKTIARALGWSEPRVSRLLTGQLAATLEEVSAFLAVCMVTGRKRDHLMSMVPDLTTPGWHQQFGSCLPEQVHTLIEHERKSTDIFQYGQAYVPGLLQTGDYARAAISAIVNVPRDEIDSRVDARLGRRAILGGEHPPNFTFYLDGFMFLRVVGDTDVMSEQAHHLLRVSVRPNISIRIIPGDVGVHAGINGPCRLMESHAFKPVAYLEGETSGHFLEDPAETTAYRNLFRSLDTVALDEAESRRLLRTIAERYADGEQQDDLG
jgi:hypothetical protein